MLAIALVMVPIVAVVALGAVLNRVGLLPPAGRATCSQLVYWIALPALLMVKLSAHDPLELMDPAALTAMAVVFALIGAGALLATTRLSPAARGSAVCGMTRFNGAFVGLPVVVLAVEQLGPAVGEQLVPAYLVVLAAMVPVTHVVGIVAILLPQHGLTRDGMGKMLRGLVRNPILLGCAAGVCLGLTIPGCLDGGPIGRSLALVGSAAVPLALLSTGAALSLTALRGRLLLIATAASVKLLLLPAAVFAATRWLGCDTATTVACVILAACPTAVSSVPVARELGADEDLMAACVVASTLCAPVTLGLWLWLTSTG